MNLLFDQMLLRLLESAAKARKQTIASTTLTIARARYTISAERKSDWLNFAVDAFSAFEQVGANVMDRSAAFE